ncbi:hypothetical protein L9F63_023323, partial [Diploptera punctata]
METWLKISLLLCIFGAVKEFRPSEPFITPYLLGEWKNFTEEQVNQEIFPVGTYTYLAALVVVFLVTDLLRYKPVIIIDGLFAVATWSLLIWGKDVLAMQILEIFYGFFMAAEVAYYTYIYAQVDREHYQKVTSHTRTAYLFGRAMSGIVSQILVSTGTMDYHQLNYISLTSVSFATIWAFFLPSVRHSIYFYRENNNQTGIPLTNSSDVKDTYSSSDAHYENKIGFVTRWKNAHHYLWRDFKIAYTNLYVLKWSLWWALATCGFLQCLNYIQLIWQSIMVSNNQNINRELYNGAVEALYTLIGAGASLGLGWLRLNWQVLGDATMAVCSIIEGLLIIYSALTNSMMAAYICYILFGVIYHTMITVANAEVAKHLSEDSYGLIFGINTFIALALQSTLTLIVVSEAGLGLEIHPQVRGSYLMSFINIYLV